LDLGQLAGCLIYKELEAKKTGVKGWENREAALQTIRESELRYQRSSDR